jgi:NAD(P)-dependent dehydrogenase (short-subunit alcohol dehydrogenase family)
MATAAAPAAARRLAVVTGANQGIGLEIARGLAVKGMHVIATARDPTKGAAAVEALRASGALMLEFHQLDITDQASIAALARYITDAHGGRLNVLVNNAGVAFKGDAWGAVEARTTVNTNFRGTAAVTAALLPALRAAAAAAGGSGGAARIVNVCSQAGRLGQVAPPLQARFQDPSASEESIGALVGTRDAAGQRLRVAGCCECGRRGDFSAVAPHLLTLTLALAPLSPPRRASAGGRVRRRRGRGRLRRQGLATVDVRR